MIQSDERGITLNKPLAYTMLAALCSLVWYGGTTVASLEGATEALATAIKETREETRQALSEDRRSAVQLEVRVRALEGSANRLDVRLEGLSSSLDEVKTLLRQIAAQQR